MGSYCCAQEVANSNETQIETRPIDFNSTDKKFSCHATKKITLLKVSPDLFIPMKRQDIYSVYSLGKALGEGAYGQVSTVTNKRTGMIRAMKAIRKDSLFEEEEQKLFQEMNILKDLDHPNIVKLCELFQDEKYYYLVTEYLQGGELFDRIQKAKTFSEKDAAHIMRQILSGVAYCHTKQIVHRDLKPENIVFTSKDEDAQLKIIDFGTSRRFESNKKMTKRLGTPYYIAPEVLLKQYNEKCDVWSCGVILFILLAGYPPFYGKKEVDIYQKIVKAHVSFHTAEWSRVSEPAKQLILKMLCKNVDQRISAQDALNDAWMIQHNQTNLVDQQFLKNISQFSAKSKLKQSLLTFMACQMIQQNEVEDIQKKFKELDQNGDGTVSKEELIKAFQEKLLSKDYFVESLDEQMDKVIKQIDTNLSGKIDYTEFIIVCLQQQRMLTEEKIKQAFKILDMDGNNFISKDEFQQVMEGVDDILWNEFLEECDEDKDGKISEEEFIQIIMNKI
ncbi:unnamed protein product [Paramecium primaurelia]|uniref:Calcium-dependent protein kinase 1 n=1 Tax=Paramecium primaurelia TaxID=5886 RepID=A0A8S1LNG6_PARPR|nr:unnamed protein product [Paramecium primaurelia]